MAPIAQAEAKTEVVVVVVTKADQNDKLQQPMYAFLRLSVHPIQLAYMKTVIAVPLCTG
jgi:hypothetical protein